MTDHKHEEESFKVIDRRLFNAEGELRQEAVEQERREEAAVAKKETKPAPATGSAPPPSTAAAPSQGFKALMGFLAQNAELVLRGFPDPRTGQTGIDVESLRQIIEMFEALREKTQGNLAAEDSQILQEIIGDLKYNYVQLTQSVAAAAVPPGAARAGHNPTKR